MVKDLLGKPLEVGQHVFTVANNRIVIARVTHFTDRFVWVQPIESTAGKVNGRPRRAVPPQKPLRKYEYNVVAVNPQDITWASLTDSL
jgi:hypothetical protein